MISRFEVQSIDLEICATITYEKKKKKNSKLWNVKIEASKKKSNL